jgi:hypothetical protein
LKSSRGHERNIRDRNHICCAVSNPCPFGRRVAEYSCAYFPRIEAAARVKTPLSSGFCFLPWVVTKRWFTDCSEK